MTAELQLRAPTLEDCQAVGTWRQADEVRPGLRTTHLRTQFEQRRFYELTVSNPSSGHRYWSVYAGEELVAFTGLTNLDWEAGHAEISLLVGPNALSGTGGTVVGLVLREAFERMRLLHVFGECYAHNPAWGFWLKMLWRHNESGYVSVPGRKWWDGGLNGAYLFWFCAP